MKNRSASLPQRVSAGPIPATDTTGISPRSKWSKYAAGFVAGVLLTFGVEAVLTGKLAAGLFEQRPAWHLEDTIDVEALEIQQCAVQPSPRQIVYNRIGKAGSMSVSQALINVHKHNGFLWKNLPTGEYGTEQQALELVQQYVGLGLGCLELTSSSAQEGDGVQQTSKLRSGAGGVAPSDGSVGATAVATASLPEDVNLPACEKVIYIGHVFFFDLEDYLHQPHSSSSSTPRDNTDSRRITFQRPAYVNFLRDPVDRYLSQYSYWRTLPDIGPATVVAGATIEQCMAAAAAAANSNSRSVGSKDDDDDGNDDHHLFGCPPVNYMTSYLCGLSPHCSDPPDYQTFLRAKRNLVEECVAEKKKINHHCLPLLSPLPCFDVATMYMFVCVFELLT